MRGIFMPKSMGRKGESMGEGRMAIVTLVDGKRKDMFQLRQIDTTHFYFKGFFGTPDGNDGSVFHVGELRYGSFAKLDEPVWDWLRGIREIDGLEVMA
jgi:hypothetical protein